MNLIYNDRVLEQVISWLSANRLGDAHDAKYGLDSRIYSYPIDYEVEI